MDWPETRLRLHLWLHQAWPFRTIAWLRTLCVPKSKGFGKSGDKKRTSEDARILQELLDTADELSTYGVMSTTDMARVRALCDEAENARLPAVLDLRAITPRAPLSAADKAARYRSGRFAEMTKEPAGLTASQANTDKQRFNDVIRKLGDKTNVMHLRADHAIFDPKNDHLFTAKAAHKAFEHLKDSGDEFEKLKARRDEHGIVRLTPQERQADSEELARIDAPNWRRVSTKVVRTAEEAQELQRVKAQLADAVEVLKAKEGKREERVANFVIWGIVLGILVAFVAAVAAIVFMK
ncbi:MAG: hypothetical protein Q7T10_16155 [Rhodoferax sp.]|uniref:hypothetical protein n=1 Tax=Rhodoferax sp. TaxID=50421 RepID=UPI00271C98ED|nr:hypothetical protein [Rhodoferax sp.]MDO8450332.1 hypothetical protein [Rhodoferax sp.]